MLFSSLPLCCFLQSTHHIFSVSFSYFIFSLVYWTLARLPHQSRSSTKPLSTLFLWPAHSEHSPGLCWLNEKKEVLERPVPLLSVNSQEHPPTSFLLYCSWDTMEEVLQPRSLSPTSSRNSLHPWFFLLYLHLYNHLLSILKDVPIKQPTHQKLQKFSSGLRSARDGPVPLTFRTQLNTLLCSSTPPSQALFFRECLNVGIFQSPLPPSPRP